MKKEKDIDNIFKKGFEHPDDNHGHLADDWEAMEKMLDERKKRPFIVYWLPVLGGIAALLMLFIGWWLLRPDSTHHQNNQVAITKDTGKMNMAGNHAGLASTKANDTITPKSGEYQSAKKAGSNAGLSGNSNIAQNIHHRSAKPFAAVSGSDSNKGINTNDFKHNDNSQLVAYSESAGIGNKLGTDQSIAAVNVLPQQPSNSSLSVNKSNKNKSALAYRPQFALSVLASTDKNGVNSFQQSKAGDNAGLLFSMGVSRKLTISAGAIYTSKQYMTDFAEYHSNYQFAVAPSSVLADCKMFDIPLNIDYLVYHKHNNKLSFGTGISSYIMLHENYQFNFSDNSIGTSSYNVPNPNKYLFSIVNIQATYVRQVNSKFGITFQPYLKIPLSAVGYSQVRLQTTGVAVGVTWNLNSLSKP